MASVANILGRMEEIDWSPYWHGPHPERPATDIPSQLRALVAGATPGGLSQLTADFTLGSEAHALLVPFLFELLEAPEVEPRVRRFLTRSLHTLAWNSRWLFNTLTRPDDDKLDADVVVVRSARMPPDFHRGGSDIHFRIWSRYANSREEFAEARDQPIPLDADELTRGSYLQVKFGVTMGAHYPAAQATRAEVGAGLERSSLLEDEDALVVEEAVVVAATFPRRAGVLAPRLWSIVQRNTKTSPLALLALSVLRDPRVKEGLPVMQDALDPRDERSAFYVAAAEAFSSTGPFSRSARARLAKKPSPQLAQVACPFAGTLGVLAQHATNVVYPPR